MLKAIIFLIMEIINIAAKKKKSESPDSMLVPLRLLIQNRNVITDKDKVLYTQNVVIDTKKYEVRFHNNGQIEYTVPLK